MKKLILSLILFIFFHLASAQVVNLNVKVFLEGPYFNGQMTPFLNVLDYLPLEQPYDTIPWGYNGGETIVTIPNSNVVDWVLVDLLKPTGDTISQSFELLSRKAGFVLSDGTITDLDGTSHLAFVLGNNIEFYIQVHHRNHLSIISAIPLIETKGVYEFDFTTEAEKAIGGAHAQKQIATGVWGMYAADGNASNQIDNRDKNEVWETQQGTLGYLKGDFNMDSEVDDNDKTDKWVENIGHGTNIQIFIPFIFTCGDTINDARDGNRYTTVLIGEQCWMAENLNVGTRIDGAIGQSNNEVIEKYCHNDIEDNCNFYGGLYRWDEMMKYETYEGVQGICPTGWHVPFDAEWCILENEVDSDTVSCTIQGYRGFDGALNLKSSSGWLSGGDGTDIYGFSVYPGGLCTNNGNFGSLISNAYFWTSTQKTGYSAWERNLYHSSDRIKRYEKFKAYAYSVRCLLGEPLSHAPPSQPAFPRPESGSIDIKPDTILSWHCFDPDGDIVTYNIYFGTETNPPLVQTILP